MEERKYYKLTQSQISVFRQWQISFRRQILNIPTSVILEQKLDDKLFEKAVKLAVERNDSFAIRFTKRDKQLYQYYDKPELLSLETRKFKSDEELEKYFTKMAHMPCKLYDRPLASIVLFTTARGTSGIFLNACHLMLDSWGIHVFYGDVLNIYVSLRDGTPMPLPLFKSEDVLKKELAVLDSPEAKKGLEFWENEISDEPIFTSFLGYEELEKWRKKDKKPNSRYAMSLSLSGKGAHEVLKIPKEDVDLVIAFCKENQVPMQVPFLIATRSYLSKVNRREKDVMFMQTLARRETVEKKRSGGTMANGCAVRTIVEEDISFLDLCNRFAEKQLQIYRYSNIDLIYMLKMMKERFGTPFLRSYFTTLMTYQPLPLSHENFPRAKFHWYCNGTASLPVFLTIVDDDGSGGHKIFYEYSVARMTVEAIHRFHDYMLRMLRQACAKPDTTIGELLDI